MMSRRFEKRYYGGFVADTVNVSLKSLNKLDFNEKPEQTHQALKVTADYLNNRHQQSTDKSVIPFKDICAVLRPHFELPAFL
jgi:hypothetical protein